MPSQRRMLKSPYPSVRVQTVHQLSSRPNPRRLKPLIALLTDTDAGVRQAAAEALGKLGDPRAVQPLIAALTDTNARVVARALGELGDRRAVQPLIALLTDTHAGVGVRQEAAEALGKLGDPRAVQPLAAALTDTDMRVCNAAARMLGELGWQPENDRQRATLAITLGRWDEAVRFGPAAVEPLITALASGWNPRAAAQALGKLGDPQPLITALTDTDSGVRREAAIALGKLGDPRAARPLITALADTDSGVRETAAAALEKFGDAAVQPLAAALTDTEPAVRKAVARKLGELGWQPENDRQRAPRSRSRWAAGTRRCASGLPPSSR